jgi:hypothetical protein
VSGSGNEQAGLVFNISAGGACLHLSDAATTPKTMQVHIAGVGRFDGRRAWVNHGRLGVAFLEPPDIIQPILDEALVTPRVPL